MTEDHPFKHPEYAVRFLTNVGAMALGALGVAWLFQGARLNHLPGLAIAIAFIVAMAAWGPIFHRIAGRLPAEAWNEVPKNARWSELLFSGLFVLSFLVWIGATGAIALIALSEVEQ